MRRILRIFLGEIGFHGSYHAHSLFDCADPESGEPVDTLILARNGGGKTSALSLLYSTLQPDRRRFLNTLRSKSHVIEDYVDLRPAWVVVEWNTPGQAAIGEDAPTLLTGQILCRTPRHERNDPVERFFFTIETGDGFRLESLPAHGLGARSLDEALAGRDQVRRWINDMNQRLNPPGEPPRFHCTDMHVRWLERLDAYGIDSESFDTMLDFCRDEGGIDAFFRFRSEADFLERMLRLVLPEEKFEEQRRLLENKVRELEERPRKERAKAFLDHASEMALQALDAAAVHAAGRQALDEERLRAGAMRIAFDHRRRTLESDATAAREAMEDARRAGVAAERSAQGALARVAGLELLALERRLGQAELRLDTARNDVARAEHDIAVLGAADLRQRHDRLAASIAELEALLAAAEEGQVAPVRAKARRAGAKAAAALAAAAAQNDARREAAMARDGEIRVRLGTLVGELQDRRSGVRDLARRRDRLAHLIELDEQARIQLLEDGTVADGETAEQAARRLDTASQAARGGIAAHAGRIVVERQALAAESEALSAALAAAAARKEARRTLAGRRADAGTRHAALAEDAFVLQANDTHEAVDPLLPEVLDAVRGRIERLRREDRRDRSAVDKHRTRLKAIETSRLDGVDPAILDLVDRLHDHGIEDATPYAAWLTSFVKDPEAVQAFAATNPAAFGGIALQRPASLAAVRSLADRLTVDAPVTLALASTDPGTPPTTGITLLPKRLSVFDPREAEHEAARIRDALAQLEDACDERAAELESGAAALSRLERFQEDWGDGRWDALRQALDAADADLAAAAADEAGRRQAIIAREESLAGVTERRRQAEKEAEDLEARIRAVGRYRERHEEPGRCRREELNRDAAAQVAAETEVEVLDRLRGELQDERPVVAVDLSRLNARAAELARLRAEVSRFAPAAGNARGEDADRLLSAYREAEATLEALIAKHLGPTQGKLAERREQLAQLAGRLATVMAGLAEAAVVAAAAAEDVPALRRQAELRHRDLLAERGGAAADLDGARRARDDFNRSRPGVTPTALEDGEELETVLAAAREEAERQRTLRNACKDEADSLRNKEAGLRAHASRLAGLVDRLRSVSRDAELPCAVEDDLPLAVAQVDAVTAACATLTAETARRRSEQDRTFQTLRLAFADPVAREVEPKFANELDAATPELLAAHRRRILDYFEQRRASLAHELASDERVVALVVEELARVLEAAIELLYRVQRNSGVPKDIPEFGGRRLFRFGMDRLARGEQRHALLRDYFVEHVRIDQPKPVPPTSLALAKELLLKIIPGQGRRPADKGLGIEYLKIYGDGSSHYLPIRENTGSGGENLTLAMLMYLILARMRAESHGGRRTSGSGVLILDNPFGKANLPLFLRTQRQLAARLGIQLIFVTGIKDTASVKEFDHVLQMRANAARRGAKQIVQVVGHHLHLRQIEALVAAQAERNEAA